MGKLGEKSRNIRQKIERKLAASLTPDTRGGRPNSPPGTTESSIGQGTGENDVQDLITKLRDYNNIRTGFQLQLAGGVTFDAPENDFEDLRFNKLGLWVNPSYSLDEHAGILSDFSLVGVFRYTWVDLIEEGAFGNYDVGGSLVWADEESPLSLTGEVVKRYSDHSKGDSMRYAGSASYRINNDISLYFSAGQDLDNNFDDNKEFFTISGISFRLGSPAKSKLK
ncbi:MAG: hypothetical protein AAGA18_14830 [Verrucomicrobiota bacterium]